MSGPNSEDAANAVAELVAQMSEVLAPIEEAARGYRERLKTEYEWTDKAAQEIATEYFKYILRVFASNM